MDLSRRERLPELMDDPRLGEHLHRQALRGLERINRISGVSRLLWRAIRPLCAEVRPRPLRILDVGCGGGDISVGVWQHAQRAGHHVQVGGCDISPRALQISAERARAAGADARYMAVDVLNDPLPSGWDVMYCCLFLHHFDEADGVRLLRNMAGTAGRLVLVSDLVRGWPGFAMCWCGVRLLTRSPIVHVDGPLSVRAGFRPHEVLGMAEQAGMTGARLSRHWPQRLLLTWHRSGQAPSPSQDS